MGTFTRHSCKVAWNREAVRRETSAITDTHAKPFDIFETIDIPEPKKEFLPLYPVNDGRNVGAVANQGYPVGEGSIEMWMQTGIWLYYILGACATTGASDPYTHAITEANTLPSFAIHFEQILTSNNIVKQLIGCHANELIISAKKDESVKATLNFLVAKSYDVTANIFSGDITNFTDQIFEWVEFDATVFSYNSEDMSGFPIDSVDISIKNEIELLPKLGDAYRDHPSIGKREYEIKMFIYPESDTLYELRDLHPGDYTTSLALTVKITRGATDYIQLTFDKLMVVDYPNKIPSMDDKELGVEVIFRLAPGGTCVVEVKDNKSAKNYEG